MTARITSYQQAVDWIFGLINYERKPGRTRDFRLDRTRALLNAVGNPHHDIPVVHIAGTKGKGSTATMLAAMLQGSGLTTGLFTSPHITRFEERFTVNDEQATEAEVVALVQELQDAVASCDELVPTYFEAAMLLAWCFYRKRKADIAVLEVGLGGRLDATNVCHPKVCVVTSISLDHTNVLGDTLDKIAGEKAGIIKPNIPVICGVTEDPARSVIHGRAAKHDCTVTQLNRDITVEYTPATKPEQSATINVSTPLDLWADVAVPLVGEHQGNNLAVAIGAFDALRQAGWNLNPAAASDALANVRLPGRVEILSRDPLVIIDAAHNEASMAALVRTLDEISTVRPRVAIFGTTKQKDAEGMLEHLLRAFDHVVLTQYLHNPRAIPWRELNKIAGRIRNEHRLTAELYAASTPTEAWDIASSLYEPAMICTTGSFFIAAEMRALLAAELGMENGE
jgi:dihydrofolate synthase/folylpolyglutamate synthase